MPRPSPPPPPPAACLPGSVLHAHPVRELATEDDSINVEMDPEDEFCVRQRIDAAGLRVVGWYHSHPTFPTQPSTIDIFNQVTQQHHHRHEASGAEPYVAGAGCGVQGAPGRACV